MLFGPRMSQNICQMYMDQIAEHCPSVIVTHDDIAIHGKYCDEHDKNLLNLMKVMQENGPISIPKHMTADNHRSISMDACSQDMVLNWTLPIFKE